MHDPQLPEALIERVLERLGLNERPAVDLDGLATIYDRWCRQVPFDNVRKLIHVRSENPAPLPGDTPVDFFEAWLEHGTGGTCWSGNGALHGLLSALGFDARATVCTMMAAPDIPPNHGSVTVALGGGLWMVDASILHVEPLLLQKDRVTGVEHPAWGVGCALRDGRFHVTWKAPQAPDGFLCRLERLDATREEFRERHEATRTWSPFNYALCARLVRAESVVGAWAGDGTVHDSGGLRTRSLDERERVALLVELGFSEEIASQVPADIEMPPPPSP